MICSCVWILVQGKLVAFSSEIDTILSGHPKLDTRISFFFVLCPPSRSGDPPGFWNRVDWRALVESRPPKKKKKIIISEFLRFFGIFGVFDNFWQFLILGFLWTFWFFLFYFLFKFFIFLIFWIFLDFLKFLIFFGFFWIFSGFFF